MRLILNEDEAEALKRIVAGWPLTIGDIDALERIEQMIGPPTRRPWEKAGVTQEVWDAVLGEFVDRRETG